MMYRRFQLITKKKQETDLKEIDAPSHGSYGALLFDKRWKNKRQEILVNDNYSCVFCKSIDNLQVHHRQYHYVKAKKKFLVPWDYPNKLLITLCESCHQKGHQKFKVPIIKL